jgi:hypothetical protein
VTKAAQVGIQMELTKHIGTKCLSISGLLCFIYCFEFFHRRLLVLLLQDLKLQSLYRLVLITALHGQTIQDLLLALDVIYLHLLLLLDLECKCSFSVFK